LRSRASVKAQCGKMYQLEPTPYLWIRVTAACLLLGQLPARALTTPEIVKRAKPAVVEIVALDEKGSPTKLGTGFFISTDGLVVTNCHVIQGASSLAAFDNHGALFGLDHVLACSADPDLAILKFTAHDVSFLQPSRSGVIYDGTTTGPEHRGDLVLHR
jgi:S1-C subfamily serine protease